MGYHCSRIKSFVLGLVIFASAGLVFGQAMPKTQPATAKLSLSQSQAIRHLPQNKVRPGTGVTIQESEYGTPMYIRGILTAASPDKPETIATRFLEQQRGMLKMEDERNAFTLVSRETDTLGYTHVKFDHTYSGIKVWPETVVVHVNRAGEVYCFNGKFRPVNLPDVEPAVSENDAASRALAAYPCEVGATAETSLVVYSFHIDAPLLAWMIELRPRTLYPYRYTVFIDAKSGREINAINGVETGSSTTSTGYLLNNLITTPQAVTLNTWRDNDGKVYLVDASKAMFPGTLDTSTFRGTIYVIETNHTNTSVAGQTYLAWDLNGDNRFNDTTEVLNSGMASYYFSRVYDYYRNTLNRNSVDDNGMAIKVYVNFRQSAGQGFDNAFWDGQEVVVGDGGIITNNWAGGLDLLAHEFTHGVTQYTSKLVYQFESGALNESMSDVFGACVDSDNWLIGEAIIITPNPYGSPPALRDMADPHNGQASSSPFWQPASMSEFQNLPANQDNGGVHANSGIPNRAFYLTANSLGRTSAAQIWYRAETSYLTANTDFKLARQAFEQAAIDLFGANTTQHNAVKSAFDTVGIQGSQTPTPNQYYLYYPLANNFSHYGKNFTGFVGIVNTAGSAAQYTIMAFTANGNATGPGDQQTLAPHAMAYYIVPDGAESIQVTADQRCVGFGDSFGDDNRVWIATTPSEYFSPGLFIPHVLANDSNWFSLCGISNVVNTTSDVIYVDNADQYAQVYISAQHQTAFFDFEQDVYHGVSPDVSALGGLWGLFANYDLSPPPKLLEPNLVAGEIFGMKYANDCAGLSLDAETGRTILFSHIANPPTGWWTGIALINLETDPNPGATVHTQPIKVLAFGRDQSGNAKVLKETIINVPYLGKLVRLAHVWTDNDLSTGQRVIPDGTEWLMVSYLGEGSGLTGYELFGMVSPPANSDSLAGLECAKYVSNKLYFPQAISGTVDSSGLQYWNGIAVINPNATTANLIYRLYDSSGVLRKTVTRQVGPYKKDVGYLSELFNVTDFWGWVEVESDQYITGFELYGFTDFRAVGGITAYAD